MAAHDLGHLDSVRWSTGRHLHHLGDLAEVLWTDRGWRDGTKRLHVLASVVVEPVNGAARNAKGLPRPDVDRFAVDGPGQHAFDAVDRLFVVIVAMRRSRQTLRGWDRELEDRDAATRVFSRDQEAHGERPETDSLVGGIDVEVGSLRCHRGLLWGDAAYGCMSVGTSIRSRRLATAD